MAKDAHESDSQLHLIFFSLSLARSLCFMSFFSRNALFSAKLLTIFVHTWHGRHDTYAAKQFPFGWARSDAEQQKNKNFFLASDWRWFILKVSLRALTLLPCHTVLLFRDVKSKPKLVSFDNKCASPKKVHNKSKQTGFQHRRDSNVVEDIPRLTKRRISPSLARNFLVSLIGFKLATSYGLLRQKEHRRWSWWNALFTS